MTTPAVAAPPPAERIILAPPGLPCSACWAGDAAVAAPEGLLRAVLELPPTAPGPGQEADEVRHLAGPGLVFPGRTGKPSEPTAVRRRFNALCGNAGIGSGWQLRESRHTAVSVMPHYGVPIEAIADAVGHANANITKAVYRHQLDDQIAAAAPAWDAFTASAKGPAEGSA